MAWCRSQSLTDFAQFDGQNGCVPGSQVHNDGTNPVQDNLYGDLGSAPQHPFKHMPSGIRAPRPGPPSSARLNSLTDGHRITALR